MKLSYYLLPLILLSGLCLGQVSIQGILSESTTVSSGEMIHVSHLLTNTRTDTIANVILYEVLPRASKVGCLSQNYSIQESGSISTLTIDAGDIEADSTINLSYCIRLPDGNYSLMLGHKTYSFMNASQERVGKTYAATVRGNNIKWAALPAIIAVLLIISMLIFMLTRRKKRKAKPQAKFY